MKKVFLLSVLAILFANFSFAQPMRIISNTEVANNLDENAWRNGLPDQDLIFPGQKLHYLNPYDGNVWEHEVVPGENQWNIMKDILSYNNVQPDVDHKAVDGEDQNPKKGMSELLHDFYWLLYFLIIFFFLLFLFFIANAILKKNRNSKNYAVTAGPSQVPGGVNDQGAHARLSQIVTSRFPNDARQRPRNVRRVNVNGTFKVYYAGAPLWWKMIHGNKPYFKVVNIKDPIVAYAGEITVGESEQTIYFLQECGNDAVQGSYMVNESNQVFINADGSTSLANATQEVFGKDSVSPEQIAEAKKSLEEKAKVAKDDEVLIEAEVLKVASEHNVIATEFLKATNAHKVTLEVVLPSGASITTILETKNQPGKADKKTDDKTEGKEN